MGTLLLHFEQLRNGLLSLNMAVRTLKMIHVKDIQKVQQNQKSLNKCTIWYWMKVREIAETTGISKECVGYILHEKLDIKKLCAKWVPHLLTADQNTLAWKSLNSAWSVLTKIKLILCVDLLLWMRLGFTITHVNPNSSKNSGQKPVVQRQRRRGRFHQQERSWHRCFGMLKAFCLLIILKRVKQ